MKMTDEELKRHNARKASIKARQDAQARARGEAIMPGVGYSTSPDGGTTPWGTVRPGLGRRSR